MWPALNQAKGVISVVPAHLNRFADLLFVAARYANHAAGVAGVVWSNEASR